MKKIIMTGLLFVTLMILLAGCVPLLQQAYEPKENSEEIWVCENPFIWFSWNEEAGYLDGKGVFNDRTENIYVTFGLRCDAWFFLHEKLPVEDPSKLEPYVELFVAKVDFYDGKFVGEVEEDFKNIFNGELPTLTFRRYNKKEYIREHGELE